MPPSSMEMGLSCLLLKGKEDGVYEFQNEEHDFPSIIRYRYDSDSSITISLMSKESPNEANLSYQLKRIQR